jgi:multicomponent Na+:H+ antiporter subunit F
VTALLYGVAVVLALNVLVGLVRVALGPAPGDRLVAALLFGTTGVALLVVLSVATDMPALRNVSLVLVVLAALVVVVYVGDDVTGRRPAADEDGPP